MLLILFLFRSLRFCFFHARNDGYRIKLGMNDETVEGVANLTNNPRFAYDSYRRFIQMFSNVVLEIDGFYFEQFLEE